MYNDSLLVLFTIEKFIIFLMFKAIFLQWFALRIYFLSSAVIFNLLRLLNVHKNSLQVFFLFALFKILSAEFYRKKI